MSKKREKKSSRLCLHIILLVKFHIVCLPILDLFSDPAEALCEWMVGPRTMASPVTPLCVHFPSHSAVSNGYRVYIALQPGPSPPCPSPTTPAVNKAGRLGGGEVWYSLIHGHLVLYSHKIFGLNVILRKADGEREGGCNEDHWYGRVLCVHFYCKMHF